MLKDQTDLLCAFNAHNVEYLVIGGHAVGEHSQPRGTKDLDLLIRSDERNSKAVFEALASYGAPLAGLSAEDFNNKPDSVSQIGVEPARIDILQSIPAVTFISRDDLIQNKLAVGRYRDLDDVERLRPAAKLLSRP